MPAAFEMASRVLVCAPPERVWDVFCVVQDWPKWSRVCVGVSNVSPRLWDVGERFSFRLRMAGLPVPFTVRVVESDPPRRVAWSSTELSITATRTFTFEGGAGSTLVTDRKRFCSPLLPIHLFYPRWLIRDMTRSWLADLRREVERREPP